MGHTDRDFTLRQLRTFICAARAGSFSHAAAELGISQPAVSDQIALLENRLGHTLFVRRLGTTPKLTEEGLKLLETAGALIDTSKAMRCEKGRHQQHRVRMYVGPRVLDLYLKPMLPELHREVPGLSIELLHSLPRPEIPMALERGRIDLLVYTVNQIPQDWQNSRVLCEVMIVMAGPAGIRQRLEDGERIEDLQFILPSVGNTSENWLERYIQQHDIKLTKPIIYMEFADVIQRMVEDGEGVTILTYEQLARAIAAGRIEVFGPALPSMRRVLAQSNHAPRAAGFIADRLVRAMSCPPPGTLKM